MKKILLILFLVLISYSKEIYFMPKEGKKTENRLFYLFTHAKKEIKIIIYTFTNKKLAKALKIAAKKGVKVTIIADKQAAKYQYSVIPRLATLKNFDIYLLSGKKYKNNEKAKMHVKLSIVDNKYVVTGSANYSYSAFYKNYEYILIHKDKILIAKFNNFFNNLKTLSTSYRLSR